MHFRRLDTREITVQPEKPGQEATAHSKKKNKINSRLIVQVSQSLEKKSPKSNLRSPLINKRGGNIQDMNMSL